MENSSEMTVKYLGNTFGVFCFLVMLVAGSLWFYW